MIHCLLLALGIGSALGGVSIQMPYLNPAGVTYTGLHSAAVPAEPSQIQYSAATTSSVAYGNAAFLGRSLAPAVSYAAPVAQYAAPVAHYTAPVAHYAAPVVPAVHHVPAVAQVPITKYEAQSAVIQNLVDVAKPKFATRKIEIRRPAIQKQFYDVEERVIVRPAGSAVVELDQPVSKSQKGPTVVQPALQTVATPLVGFRSLHSHHHVVPAAYPASFSVHPYPIQGPASIPITSSPTHPQEIEAQPEEINQQLLQITEQQEGQQTTEQQEGQQIPQQEPQQESQQPPQQEFQQFPQQEPQQFDDSDSVAVDNPDIARARSQQPQTEQPQQAQSFLGISQQGQAQPLQGIPQPQDLLRTLLPQSRRQFFVPQQQLIERFQAMNVDRQQAVARSQVQAQEQVVAQLQAQTQAQQAQLQRSEQLLQLQQQQLERSRLAVEAVAMSQLEQQQQQQQQEQSQPQSQSAPSTRSQNEQSDGLQSVGPEPQRGSVRILEASDLRSALINNIARSTSSPSEIRSFRISPEQSISNQERLISLLTERGGVVEARSHGESSDSHQVRARVLSVTPAPEGASPQEEKVNTRRIVVSRPIHTVEELDVVEPFTKIERVAVHSPAVIKTARLGVAHLPTSVPVHGYAHAHALHAAIPAY